MPGTLCPHCGIETPQVRHGYWRHVRACSKNPNPACPKCGLHFERADALEEHLSRCGSTKAKRAARDPSPQPAASAGDSSPQSGASAASPEAAQPRFLNEVPEDRLTSTDKLILPLLSAPDEKPAEPAPSEAKPKRRARAAKAADSSAPTPPPASPAVAPAAQDKGVAASFEAARAPPRFGAWAGFGESIKRNWVLLLVIGVLLLAVILWRRMSRNDAETPVQPTAPPPPSRRPPYNPELHGTLEAYRAAYEHLPTNGGA